jgi:hypothetical protein
LGFKIKVLFYKKNVLNYTIYENQNSTQWVTFAAHQYGSNKSGILKNAIMYSCWICGHGNSKSLKTAFKQNYTFSALANDILEVLDFLKLKNRILWDFVGTILIRQLAEMYPQSRKHDTWRAILK